MDTQPERCLNCGADLTGKYCAQCGQKNISPRQTLGELVVNFIGSFTSFESKFFKTVLYLLFRPGFLVKEYNIGRRESYFHPARAYVFSSFVFFLIFFWLSFDIVNPDQVSMNNEESADSTTTTHNNINISFGRDLQQFKTVKEYDSVQLTLPEDKRDGWLRSTMSRKQIEIVHQYENRGGELLNNLVNKAIGNVPKVFFILLPIFALILKLLYIRRDYYYSEHLVFSVVFYNFIFVSFSIIILISLIPWLSWMIFLLFILPPIYLGIALKKVYGQGILKTSLKLVILTILFVGCILLATSINFAISVLTL